MFILQRGTHVGRTVIGVEIPSFYFQGIWNCETGIICVNPIFSYCLQGDILHENSIGFVKVYNRVGIMRISEDISKVVIVKILTCILIFVFTNFYHFEICIAEFISLCVNTACQQLHFYLAIVVTIQDILQNDIIAITTIPIYILDEIKNIL